MNQRTWPTLIGIFVIGAVSLSVVGVVFFGGGEAFVEKRPYVMYFDGSLNGLDIGAPVLFRGVRIGSVTRIVLRYYVEEQRPEIPVFVEVIPDIVERIGPPRDEFGDISVLVEEQGLRAQLILESFVTGKLAVQLDFHEEDELAYVGSDPGIPEIPTIPSAREALQKTLLNLPVEEMVAEIRSTLQAIDGLARNLDEHVDPVLTSVRTAFDGANDLVRSEGVAKAITSIEAAVADIGRLSRKIEVEVGPLSTRLQETLARADAALLTLKNVIEKDSPLHYSVTRALNEVAEAAQSMSELAELLKRRPEVLLQGKR